MASDWDELRIPEDADLSAVEVARQVGSYDLTGSDALRQRLAALLDEVADDEEPYEGGPDDARLAGAAISRLDGHATGTAIAQWLGWTTLRTNTAIAELDRRLARCGLRAQADNDGLLRIRPRARLRRRPETLASGLLAGLDQPAVRHALAHLVRSDEVCLDSDFQPVIDLGAVQNHRARHPRPHPALAAAFVGAVTTKYRDRIILIDLDRPRSTKRRRNTARKPS